MVNPQHLQEWRLSCVDPKLVELNVLSLEGEQAWEYLFYSDKIERLNSGRLPTGLLKSYQHIEQGGQWIGGLDPLNNWDPMVWGRFKPNSPRVDFTKGDGKKAKKVKYESPIKNPARVTYFRVPLETWQQVSNRYGVPMPEQIIVLESGEALGFWAWVQANPQIPVILSEGEKKAACLLSFGFAAIALPGIWMGRRKTSGGSKLHPDLCPMAKGRKLIILFDYETSPKTQTAVKTATLQTGQAISDQGGVCEVAVLPGPDKGVDDWASALGEKAAAKALSLLVADALTLQDYQQTAFLNRCRGLQKHKPSLTVNTRFLSNAVQLPSKGAVFLASDLGTGKTELMARFRTSNPEARFLNNGHRVNLLKNLAERLQTEMYSSLNQGDLCQANSLSITADSLYKMAANIKIYDCVFIDECCQYLAHILLSKTCKEHQAVILDTLEYVIFNAPLVIFADAHLDDLTVDFFMPMRPPEEKPFIIKNNWRNGNRDIYWYTGSNNSELIAHICASVWSGKKVYVCSDSKRFIKKLEEVLNSQNKQVQVDSINGEAPEQLRVWAIHSENSGSEENVVFIKEIRTAIKSVDALLTSPSLGTGVDMPDYHFDTIYGVFYGATQTATECAQQLWRYRPNVPVHVWVTSRPPFGYKSCNASKIKQHLLESNRMTAFLIRRDRETGERGAEKDWALETFCKLQAQRQFSINNLRSDLRSLLEDMGNRIISVESQVNEVYKAKLKEAGEVIDQRHCESVAVKELIDKRTYQDRQSKDYLSLEEFQECEKFRIWDSYGMTVSPELVKKDNGGRFIGRLVALEELLEPTEGMIISEDGLLAQPAPPAIVAERDSLERDSLPLSFHWRNRSAAWLARYKLGLTDLLHRLIKGGEISALSDDAISLMRIAVSCSQHVKAILGTTIPPSSDPIWCISQFLDQVGLKLKEVRKEGSRGNQVRIYQLNAKSLKFATEVLEHRQRQRQEREQKRQEEREVRAEYAARMQSLYGGSKAVVTPPLKKDGENLREGVATSETLLNQAELDAWLQPESIQEVKDWWANEDARAVALDLVPLPVLRRLNLVP